MVRPGTRINVNSRQQYGPLSEEHNNEGSEANHHIRRARSFEGQKKNGMRKNKARAGANSLLLPPPSPRNGEEGDPKEVQAIQEEEDDDPAAKSTKPPRRGVASNGESPLKNGESEAEGGVRGVIASPIRNFQRMRQRLFRKRRGSEDNDGSVGSFQSVGSPVLSRSYSSGDDDDDDDDDDDVESAVENTNDSFKSCNTSATHDQSPFVDVENQSKAKKHGDTKPDSSKSPEKNNPRSPGRAHSDKVRGARTPQKPMTVVDPALSPLSLNGVSPMTENGSQYQHQQYDNGPIGAYGSSFDLDDEDDDDFDGGKLPDLKPYCLDLSVHVEESELKDDQIARMAQAPKTPRYSISGCCTYLWFSFQSARQQARQRRAQRLLQNSSDEPQWRQKLAVGFITYCDDTDQGILVMVLFITLVIVSACLLPTAQSKTWVVLVGVSLLALRLGTRPLYETVKRRCNRRKYERYEERDSNDFRGSGVPVNGSHGVFEMRTVPWRRNGGPSPPVSPLGGLVPVMPIEPDPTIHTM